MFSYKHVAAIGFLSLAVVLSGEATRLRSPAEAVVGPFDRDTAARLPKESIDRGDHDEAICGAHDRPETWYAAKLALKYHARAEVVCDAGGARCDMVSDREAIEVDWAPKWAEAIGQSLYYADRLDLTPAIILLTDGPADHRYVDRCRAVCQEQGIQLHVEPIGAIR